MRALSFHRRAWLAALCALLFFVPARVFAGTVRAELSSSTAAVGEELTYQLIIGEGSLDRMPDFPAVDGLDVISKSQVSSTMRLSRGNLTKTSIYQYRLAPQRVGDIEIPAFEVSVDGEKLTTRPLTLKVTPGLKTEGPGDIAYARILSSRTRAFVGEDLSVELHCYLEADYRGSETRWGWNTASTLDGDGYSTRGVRRQGIVTRDFLPVGEKKATEGGKDYDLVVFRIIVTPNRAGKVVFGPVTVRMVYSRSVPGAFGPNFDGTKPLTIVAPALELDVQPLPVEGRPADFSGAIGKFEFAAQGRPDRVKLGDPITMALKVTGRGNFERMGAPALAQPVGWRAYPPTNQFVPTDALSSLGEKTFQVAVVPEVKKDAMPVFNFSYFDPENEKYFTIASQPASLVVEGEPAPAPAPALTALAGAPTAVPVRDILGIQPMPGFWGTLGMLPAPVFWTLLGAPAVVLGGLLASRARRTDRGRQARAELQREKTALRARLQATQDRAELFDVAGRILQIDVALATGQPLGGIDEAAVLAHGDSPAVRRLFAARAELVYAGSRSGSVSQTDRDAALEVLEQFGPTRR